jgi:DNA mismatch repair protein MutS2
VIYPQDFEQVVGFDRIRQRLKQACRYETSSAAAAQLPLLQSASEIELRLNELDEWRSFAEKHPSAVQFEGTKDILPWLPGLDVENFFFAEDELLAMLFVVRSFSLLQRTLLKNEAEFPVLCKLSGESNAALAADEIIFSVIDLKGEIRGNATVKFGKLNAEIERMEREVRNVTRNLFRHWKELGYTADIDLTVREERMVIPVKAEFKRKVNGFVKDVSATGQVLFIEPVESLELNNLLKELYADRRRERERILIETANKLRPLKEGLENAMAVLWRMDLIAAKQQISKQLDCHRPKISPLSMLELREAYNPILKLRMEGSSKSLVPLNVKLDKTERMMVISGPNAGGKSVALKTTLLLQYMAQHGLHIPASPESTCGIFNHFLIDCGDGQNIDAGLSTFSAHLQHLKKMTDHAAEGTLIGIDEIGDGTDPRFGGPIAQAVLEKLFENGATVLVTTHFSRLKEWAGKTKGVINAGMAYDTKHLQPLFRLVSGRPGGSFALELLRKTGFDTEMLQKVEVLTGEESGKAEDLLLSLEQKQKDLDDALLSNRNQQEHLEKMLAEYSKLKEKLQGKRNEILEQARIKANRMLDDANREIEKTIRIIRENRADKEKTRIARGELSIVREKLGKVEETTLVKEETKQIQVNWLPGMKVKNKTGDAMGEVLEVKKDKLKVVFGLVKMWVPSTELMPVSDDTIFTKQINTSGFNWVERNAAFSPVLDVRGQNGEDALKEVTVWLDEAYALGQRSLKIIHGRGDGVLRKILRQYFKSLPYIKNYRSESEQQGGDGCTLIELN